MVFVDADAGRPAEVEALTAAAEERTCSLPGAMYPFEPVMTM